ncbi:hypothetical protein PHLCEN_2v9982 [Hermanssonia centrifuga]|uniref:Uncharacterized protein n=1 Tax=Hermanssonia centrifuga TaxID=98765 RepID=A0A2R6NP46_9APHY|nr:hypothetical protein PHLCEN_2v9982 [Hermanssonia centrifuga]
MSTIYTSFLAGPDASSSATKSPFHHTSAYRVPPRYPAGLGLGLAKGTKAKKVRVTAVTGCKPDNSPFTTYEVDEVDYDGDSEDDPISPPLLGARRSPRRGSSPSSIPSDDSSLRTPSPEVVRAFIATWPSRPEAPRIPFPSSLSSNVGLGIDVTTSGEGAITYEDAAVGQGLSTSIFGKGIGLGITFEDQMLPREGKGVLDEISSCTSSLEDSEEAYYHLPSNLLSPELIMSATEFTDSVRKWADRRKDREERASESDVSTDGIEQAPRRKSI